MKNTSKKSKFVILPALATLVLTSVATVTGTAAWFTAARTTTVTTDAFASVKTDSSLNFTINGNADCGTSATEKNQIKLANENYKLTHGSYDAKATASGSLYVADLDDTGSTVTQYRDLGTIKNHGTGTASNSTNKWIQSGNTWYGFAWEMEFTYTATDKNETNYLLFDAKGSTFKDGTTGGQTLPGFRIAFMTDSKFLVVGEDDVITHVTKKTEKESTTITTDVFPDSNYVSINDTTDKVNDDAPNLNSNEFNLGVLSGTTALRIQCVAWFEGNDPWIANKKDTATIEKMSSVTSTLEFYTRAVHAK